MLRMAGHGAKSWEIRETIAEKLASGESVEHAVCGTKCTSRTVYKWLRDDLDFQLLVEEIRLEALEETRGLRIAAAKRAGRRLLRLIASDNERIAARAVGIALQDLGELEAKTAARKRTIEWQQGTQPDAETMRILEELNGRAAPPNGEAPKST
jgi:hypothetical protein